MSLINEALKKAQKVRTGDAPTDLPPMPGGGSHIGGRGQPRSTQTILMLTGGGLVLVLVSVGITFWLLNRPPAEKPAAAAIAAKPAPIKAPTATPAGDKGAPTTAAPAAAAPQPAKVDTVATKPTAPVREQPMPTKQPAVQSATVASTSTPVQSATQSAAPAAATAPAPVAAAETTSPPPSPVASAPVKGDERIHAFVDAIKVAGIRPSGNDSRVLMNDRVYRVNDIVERNLGVRLTKVEADALTFTDAAGAVYVKNF